ncbi:MAG: 50S ribosomal protein L25 [Gemmatimonadota bacterium]
MGTQATLSANARTSTGKGAARALRRQGKVPAVIYGHGRAPESLELEATALHRTLASITGSTLIDLTIDGKAPVKVLLREVQRHPVKPTEVIHLDLYEVRQDEKITVEVPVRLVGTPEGVRHGGVLDQVMHTLEIRVFPRDLPDHIDVDVSGLLGGHSLFVRDIKVPNAEILNEPNLPVCSIVAARAEEAPAPAEAAVAEPELIRKPKAEAEDEGEK